jgi:hypothetical protein
MSKSMSKLIGDNEDTAVTMGKTNLYNIEIYSL